MPAAPRRRPRDASLELPLGLPTPPGLPGPIVPEMPAPCTAAFDSSDWRFTVDWDGARTLLFVDAAGTVRLQNERGDDVSARFQELIGTSSIFAGHVMVLDGIVAVVDDEGRPDLRALAERQARSTGAVQLPVVYLATDLLFLDGHNTMRWSLDRRHRTLRRTVAGDLRVQVCDLVGSDGHAFAAAAAGRNLPAILARRGRAPYHPGVASPDRLRVALEDRANTVVVAVAPAPPHIGGVLITLGERWNNDWVFAGALRMAADDSSTGWIMAHFDRHPSTPLRGFPAAVPGTRWAEPSVVATVRHRGRRQDGLLRSPVLVAVRDDVDARWCVRRDPASPPGEAGHGFRPTVMIGLPLADAAE